MIAIDRPFLAERVSVKLPGSVRLRVRRTDGERTISIRSDNGGAEDLGITERDSTLRVKYDEKCARRAEYDVEIRSGASIGLRAAAPRLELQAECDLGSVDIAAAHAGVELARTEDIKIVVKSGVVRIEEVGGERAFIASASADVLIDRCDASLDTRMGTGDLRVGVLAAPLTARSATGDVAAEWTGADVEIRSGSGAVSLGVRADIANWLDLYSGTGHIDVDVPPSEPPADGDPFVAISVATGTGDIRIFRAEGVDAAEDSADSATNPRDIPETTGKGADDDPTSSP